ncbi:U1 small nuclear ribonucleoprotein 70 kDa-like [Dermacentor silvarum]|uniref:U1 small nuclear ribonucleoprotein 70 kDa-like n=1 Tax=Dermacentor silvarum TaxID=543639 RepID=UPI00210102C0|nr:U1 small nuclear ribonucleoprotein 70 kDa-like [Dermacentor silvarum]
MWTAAVNCVRQLEFYSHKDYQQNRLNRLNQSSKEGLELLGRILPGAGGAAGYDTSGPDYGIGRGGGAIGGGGNLGAVTDSDDDDNSRGLSRSSRRGRPGRLGTDRAGWSREVRDRSEEREERRERRRQERQRGREERLREREENRRERQGRRRLSNRRRNSEEEEGAATRRNKATLGLSAIGAGLSAINTIGTFTALSRLGGLGGGNRVGGLGGGMLGGNRCTTCNRKRRSIPVKVDFPQAPKNF